MELKRILNKKNTIIIIAAVLLNLVLFTYEATQGWQFAKWHSQAQRLETAIAEFDGMEYDEILDYIKKNKLASKDSIYKEIRTQINYIQGYNKKIQGVLDRSESLKTNVLFQDEKSFAHNNIIKTGEDFIKLLDVEPVLENDYAVLKISEYNYCLPIVLIVVVIIIAGLYRERDNGMWQMVYSTQRGRFALAAKRTGIVLLITFIVLFATYGSMVVASLLIFKGTGQLLGPIQNLEKFAQSVHLISKLGYLLLNFVWEYIAIAALASIAYLLFTIFRNKKNVAIGIVAFIIVEYLFYTKIESQNVYGVLRNINVLNLMKLSDICMRYKNTGVFSLVVGIGTLLITVLFIACIISLALSAVISMKMYPSKKVGIVERILEKAGELYQMILGKMPLFLKECHKTVFSAKGVWLIAGVFLTAAYFASTDFIRFPDNQVADDNTYLEHGGKEYSYIENQVQLIDKRYEMTKAEYERVYELYKNGQASEREVSDAKAVMEFFGDDYNGVQEFRNKILYLDKLEKNRGIHGYMMSDRGYYQVLGGDGVKREVIIFVVMQIAFFLIAVSVMRLEKRTGMKQLIISSQSGQKKIHVKKIMALACVTMLVTIVVYIIDYTNQFAHYGMPYPEAPVQSLTFMEKIPFSVSIWQWIVLLVLMKGILSSVIAAAGYLTAVLVESRKKF